MGIKKNDLGKVIGQVGGFRIRQIASVGRVGNKTVTKSTQIGIFAGKSKVEFGFKTKESAIDRAKEIQKNK